MENVATHEDWKVCFSDLAPGLVLFARQWVRSPADAEDVVQDAFVRFWQRNLSIKNRALLYAAVRSAALDHLPRDQREVLVMKIWNELTFAEIGEALGISQNTEASRYRYGLAALKKTFQPQ